MASVPIAIAAFEQAAIRYLDFGGLLRPIMGGPDQRLNRIGNRFAIDLSLGEIESDGEGRILRQQLMRALSAGAILSFPQDGLEIGAPGAPVVDGSGQAGTTLNLRGFAAGYAVRAGQFFSLIHGGRRYLHAVDQDVTATGTGAASIGITPMLRVSPADGAVVEFAAPMIEGNIVGDVSWVYTPGRWQGQSLTIEEAA